jgi:hypothetical protein
VILTVRAAAPLQALQASLVVNGADVRVTAARPSRAARAALVQAHRSAGGPLEIALATASPIPAGARVQIIIDLAVDGGAPAISLNRLVLE